MRSSLVVFENVLKVSLAAAIAVFVSASSPNVTSPIFLFVEGLIRSNISVPCDETNSPLM